MTDPTHSGTAGNLTSSPAAGRVAIPKWLRQTLQLALVAGLAAFSYLFISHFFLQTVSVVGSSMTPTLYDSERYILNRWVYRLRVPQQAEVVVLRDPVDHGFSVKRVIAGPGCSVYLKQGAIYVNGIRLEEPYLPSRTPTFTAGAGNEQLFRCGKDQYFVLGDNRQNSVDSRTYGPVKRRDIVGMVLR